MSRLTTIVLSAALSFALAGCDVLDVITDDYSRYAVPGTKVSVELPAAPEFKAESVQLPCGPATRISFQVKHAGDSLSGAIHPLPENCQEAENVKVLRAMADGEARAHSAQVKRVEEITGEGGERGIEYELILPSPGKRFLTGRIFAQDGVLVQVVALHGDSIASRTRQKRFLSELRLK